MRDVATDAEGNVYVVLTVNNGVNDIVGEETLSNTTNAHQLLLLKLAPDGSLLWMRHSGDQAYVYGPYLDIDDSGNVVVASYFQGTIDMGAGPAGVIESGLGAPDVFVAKLDTDGNPLWSRYLAYHTTGGPFEVDAVGQKLVFGLEIDSAGNIYLGGTYQGHWGGTCLPTCPEPAADVEIWARKLDPSGADLWTKTYTGPGSSSLRALSLVGDEGMVFGGILEGSFDAGGMTLSGTTKDSFVMRLNAAGDTLWAQAVTAPGKVTIRSLAANDERILVAGDHDSGQPFGVAAPSSTLASFVAELDAGGTVAWSRAYESEGAETFAPAVALGPSNEAVVSLSFSGQGTFEGTTLDGGLVGAASIPVALKLDAQGDLLWLRGFGAAPNAYNTSANVTVAADGDIVIIGNHRDAIDMGDQVLQYGGIEDNGSDGYVVRLQP